MGLLLLAGEGCHLAVRFLGKKPFLGWMSGDSTQKVVIALAEDL